MDTGEVPEEPVPTAPLVLREPVPLSSIARLIKPAEPPPAVAEIETHPAVRELRAVEQARRGPR